MSHIANNRTTLKSTIIHYITIIYTIHIIEPYSILLPKMHQIECYVLFLKCRFFDGIKYWTSVGKHFNLPLFSLCEINVNTCNKQPEIEYC